MLARRAVLFNASLAIRMMVGAERRARRGRNAYRRDERARSIPQPVGELGFLAAEDGFSAGGEFDGAGVQAPIRCPVLIGLQRRLERDYAVSQRHDRLAHFLKRTAPAPGHERECSGN